MFSGISTQAQKAVRAGTSGSSPDPPLRDDSILFPLPPFPALSWVVSLGGGGRGVACLGPAWRVKGLV